MVPTRDLAAVEAIATRHGAKILLTGDPAQLSAPKAGGAMRLLAEEHGYYQLVTVQRFDAARADFPIPGSPSTSSDPPPPMMRDSGNSIAAISEPRPISSAAVIGRHKQRSCPAI